MVQPIAFVHIPKTAGNALDHFLFQEVSPGNLLQRAEDKLAAPGDFAKCEVISGHLPYFTFQRRLGSRHGQTTYLSCVRDPISRLKSNLYYHLTLGDLTSHLGLLSAESIREKGFEWTLRAVLEFEDFRMDWCRNIQWALLTTNRKFFRRATSEVDQGSRKTIAENFLKSYAAIIVQERLDDGILFLGHKTRRLIPRPVGRENTNSVKPSGALFDINDDELLEEVCGLDQVLYDTVKHMFVAQFEEMVDDVLSSGGVPETRFRAADETERYSILRELINKQILAEREERFRAGGGGNAPGLLGRAGVYPGAATSEPGCRLVSSPKRRAMAQSGRPATDVLWIGPAKPAEFWLSVAETDRGSYIGLKVGACLDYSCLSKLSITCNEKSVDYTVSEKNGEWFIVVPMERHSKNQHIVITSAEVPHIHEVDALAGPISKYTFHKVAIGVDDEVIMISADEIEEYGNLGTDGFLEPRNGYANSGPITLTNPAKMSAPLTRNVFRIQKILTAEQNVSTIMLQADSGELARIGGSGPFCFTFFLSNGQSFVARCFFEDIPNTSHAGAQINVPLGRAIGQIVGFTVDDSDRNRLGYQTFDNAEAITAVP